MITLIGPSDAPFWVKRYWVLNVFKHCNIAIIETNTTVGLRSGSVIDQKTWNLFAPSIKAASYTTGGMVERPVINRITKYPIYFQKYTIIVES